MNYVLVEDYSRNIFEKKSAMRIAINAIDFISPL